MHATVLQKKPLQTDARHCEIQTAGIISNPLEVYLTMMFVDDASVHLVDLFCKAYQLHSGRVTPNKHGLPKCIE